MWNQCLNIAKSETNTYFQIKFSTTNIAKITNPVITIQSIFQISCTTLTHNSKRTSPLTFDIALYYIYNVCVPVYLHIICVCAYFNIFKRNTGQNLNQFYWNSMQYIFKLTELNLKLTKHRRNLPSLSTLDFEKIDLQQKSVRSRQCT